MSTFLPAFWDVFHGLVRTPPEKRNHAAIAEAKAKAVALAKIFDAELAYDAYVGGMPSLWAISRWASACTASGNSFPIGRALPHMERWYAAIEKRPAYHEHVGSIPLT